MTRNALEKFDESKTTIIHKMTMNSVNLGTIGR